MTKSAIFVPSASVGLVFDLFGAHLGTITLAATLAPLLTGAVHQSSGGYNTVLTLCRAAFLSGVLLILPLGRYPRFE